MKKFYKIENGQVARGTGYEVPEGFIEYDSIPQDLQNALDAEQATKDANQYKVSRQADYPPIGDQLDALFRAGVFPDEMAAEIQAVKDRHPKEQG